MTVEQIAVIIAILSIIGLGTVVKWIVKLIKYIFRKIKNSIPQKQGKIINFPHVSEESQYYKSIYFMVTRNTYKEVVNDIGKYGEYLTYKYLKDFSNSGGRFLFNLYIPKGEGGTTEIDMLMIHEYGLFVIESKNYSGWIFGKEEDKYWTQTLGYKKGETHKEHFYNPIKQNQTHIENLKKLLSINYPIYSIITFSERCTLKDVTTSNTKETCVIKREQICRTVSSIMLNTSPALNPEEIEHIYQKQYPYTQVSDEVKKQHIEAIQNYKSNNTQ